jgi:Ca-activated chloride channel family protein
MFEMCFSGMQWQRDHSVPRIVRVCILSLVMITALQGALAQTSLDEAHVLSRPKAKTHTDTGVLTSNVDLVLVNVTVVDSSGRIVSNLRADNFTVQDASRAQQIRYCASEDTPLSVGLVIDTSGSMANKFHQVRTAALEFVHYSNPLDEFDVISFADAPALLTEFSASIDQIEPVVTRLEPAGETALWDAIYVALHSMRSATHPRKALLVISDGGDNHSRYSYDEVKSLLKESDIQVYAIDIFEPFPKRREEMSGLEALDQLTSTTGGRVFLTRNVNELHQAVRQISEELRSQYVLGYLPGPDAHDGKWHKIRVGLKLPHSRKLRIYAKKGYYAATEK